MIISELGIGSWKNEIFLMGRLNIVLIGKTVLLVNRQSNSLQNPLACNSYGLRILPIH